MVGIQKHFTHACLYPSHLMKLFHFSITLQKYLCCYWIGKLNIWLFGNKSRPEFDRYIISIFLSRNSFNVLRMYRWLKEQSYWFKACFLPKIFGILTMQYTKYNYGMTDETHTKWNSICAKFNPRKLTSSHQVIIYSLYPYIFLYLWFPKGCV